ncbi:MAG: 2OG-Fe(II) oxygenase, partial [Methyloprofundus sp.]|nr:2OG-Fe(II) oxygenase [Methyloprofundus sp.]
MLTKQLAHILQNLQSPGNFYTRGTLELFPPCLEVDQVGRISLPLLATQAEQLIEVAERAPYGKGYATLIDTEVRRTWQINAD